MRTCFGRSLSKRKAYIQGPERHDTKIDLLHALYSNVVKGFSPEGREFFCVQNVCEILFKPLWKYGSESCLSSTSIQSNENKTILRRSSVYQRHSIQYNDSTRTVCMHLTRSTEFVILSRSPKYMRIYEAV